MMYWVETVTMCYWLEDMISEIAVLRKDLLAFRIVGERLMKMKPMLESGIASKGVGV